MSDADRCLNILLVEDNSADVDLTLVAFRDALVHSRISVVTDGEEAMAFLKRTGNYTEAPSPD